MLYVYKAYETPHWHYKHKAHFIIIAVITYDILFMKFEVPKCSKYAQTIRPSRLKHWDSIKSFSSSTFVRTYLFSWATLVPYVLFEGTTGVIVYCVFMT